MLNAGRGVIAKPPANVAEARRQAASAYIEHSLVYLSKEMWRQAMAISTQQPESPFGRPIPISTVAHRPDLRADRAAAGIGLVRGDIDARSVGEMIFNNTNMMFTVFVKDEAT